ncbi:ANTAR domain-containing protein [Haloechinothrix salitolerans]|uniref:ANTAR domain-containing protein n=1 Tax=Haloechinothrix salitolerans TaxID=926830 RepID=A0ABW2C3J4_9PSEU
MVVVVVHRVLAVSSLLCVHAARGGVPRQSLNEVDERLLDLYMSAVATALRVYRRYERARELAAQLEYALGSRAVIDQAKGILMAIHAISADEAFTLLVEQSQREQVKVRDDRHVRFEDSRVSSSRVNPSTRCRFMSV